MKIKEKHEYNKARHRKPNQLPTSAKCNTLDEQ